MRAFDQEWIRNVRVEPDRGGACECESVFIEERVDPTVGVEVFTVRVGESADGALKLILNFIL